MKRTETGREWTYGGLWVLANILGWAAAGWSTTLDLPIVEGIFVLNGGFLLGGLWIGLAQGLTLAARLRRSFWLIPACGLGWYLGLALGFQFGFPAPEPLSMGAAGGLSAGVLQWLAMRRRVRRAAVWVPALALSALAGCWLGVSAGRTAVIRHAHGAVARMAGGAGVYAIGGAAAGAVIGVISGIVLVILMRGNEAETAGQSAGDSRSAPPD